MKIQLIILLLSFNFLPAEEYHVSKSDKNEVKFISDAPVEDFEGVTHQIDGFLYFEEGDLTKNSQLYFEVDLNSLDTGMGLRNRHMRENYLHTDKYPTTHFTGKIVQSEKMGESEYAVRSEGVIFIHGVEKPLTVNAALIKLNNQFRIQCKFEVSLTDFNIEIPSIMFYKIDETMDLRLDFFVKLYEKSE